MEKPIKGYEDYSITDDGKVISYKYGDPREMTLWAQKSGYLNIGLCKNNKKQNFLVHRLVAEAFIPNPENLSDVNHKNGNRQDNRVENLEWINHIDNIHLSYNTMGPKRYFKVCELYSPTNNCLGEFGSILDACKWAEENCGVSKTSLQKYKRSNGYYIIIREKE